MNVRKQDNGYDKRRMFDLKTIQILLMALLGTGGVTGLTSYLTDPNLKVQTKVEVLETKSRASDLKIATLTGNGARREMRIENYIKSHSEAEKLIQQLTDREFEHIKELLLEIKEDVKSIKNGH